MHSRRASAFRSAAAVSPPALTTLLKSLDSTVLVSYAGLYHNTGSVRYIAEYFIEGQVIPRSNYEYFLD